MSYSTNIPNELHTSLWATHIPVSYTHLWISILNRRNIGRSFLHRCKSAAPTTVYFNATESWNYTHALKLQPRYKTMVNHPKKGLTCSPGTKPCMHTEHATTGCLGCLGKSCLDPQERERLYQGFTPDPFLHKQHRRIVGPQLPYHENKSLYTLPEQQLENKTKQQRTEYSVVACFHRLRSENTSKQQHTVSWSLRTKPNNSIVACFIKLRT